jgi:hypothetical protein
MGPQSAQGHKFHIAALPIVEEEVMSAQLSYLTLIPCMLLSTHLCSLPGSGTQSAGSTHPGGKK